MKFIDRKNELKQMEEYFSLSKKQLITIAVSGLRRVGKTTLTKEFIKNKKAIYFFIYESKTSAELLREFSEELKKYEIITKLEKYNWQKGYRYYIGGELESREESFGGMTKAILIAVIGIFGVLVLQFK
ncbi:MAG: hypothetical protein L6408_07875, partial [Nanoarchaeota archaeon]|nr:hypothetical protein [Nanoarchaeota archaeon]